MYEWLSKVARLKTYATSNWLASMGLGPRESTEATKCKKLAYGHGGKSHECKKGVYGSIRARDGACMEGGGGHFRLTPMVGRQPKLLVFSISAFSALVLVNLVGRVRDSMVHLCFQQSKQPTHRLNEKRKSQIEDDEV